jgi:hypothetical protein
MFQGDVIHQGIDFEHMLVEALVNEGAHTKVRFLTNRMIWSHRCLESYYYILSIHYHHESVLSWSRNTYSHHNFSLLVSHTLNFHLNPFFHVYYCNILSLY